MKKIIAFLMALCFVFSGISNAFAATDNDANKLEISDIIIEDPVGDRGSLEDLCAAGLKQYCPENRAKYRRALTKKEKKCIASIGFATISTLGSMSVLTAIGTFGSAILSCIA
ncbi:MAG: hypothetical protein PUG67_02115 [Peptoniphilaceae bacterium]|nr:hypothetical protein [Peptoniphilaceae bacterium]MDY6018844.1 hypothetical protein [Anaerococcus sp.]